MKNHPKKKAFLVSAGIAAVLLFVFAVLMYGRPFIGKSAPDVLLISRLTYENDAASHSAGDYRLLPGDAGYPEMTAALSGARWRYDLDFARSTLLDTPCTSYLLMLDGTSFQLTDTGLMWRDGQQVHIGLNSRTNIQKLFQKIDAALESAIAQK